MPLTSEEERLQRRLERIVAHARGRGVSGLDDEELADLAPLYRHASSIVARMEAADARDPEARNARRSVERAHALLYGGGERVLGAALPRRLAAFFLHECPRAIRAEWRLLAGAFAVVYGLALVAWFAVRADLGLAYSLLDPRAVAGEIEQLEATARGEPFRGNFTFGLGASPFVAGSIMAHNIGIGLLFFGAGLLPPLLLFLAALNGLMLGTYTAVAAHWGQAGAISSILWCHGTIEIQALVLAGTGGMILARSQFAPGPWSRGHALVLEVERALRVAAPVLPLLVIAGLIEGFVSPHAALPTRLFVAVGSGIALVAWALLGGRSPASPAAPGVQPGGE